MVQAPSLPFSPNTPKPQLLELLPRVSGAAGISLPTVTQFFFPTDACAESRPSPPVSISLTPGFWPVQGGKAGAGRVPASLLGDGGFSPLNWCLPSKAFLG